MAVSKHNRKGQIGLRLFNSLGKKKERFRPVNDKVTTIFTCGPSIYQRAHIGNFRTFLFEDILVRYLEYSGYHVKRGMNITDIEDKAIKEAEARNMTVRELTDHNLKGFMEEMELLGLKIPDYLPRASETIDEVVAIIERLLDLEIAYRHQGNIYFDPLKSPDFGKLYGLDMSQWPATKKRFHRDTYPGIQWNLGDFILWHGCKKGDSVCWDSAIGKGRPSWNVQDPSMIGRYCEETLSIYCGGYDNLYRHHDYTRAILESVRPYPTARYWLHGHHLYVSGKKMSKSLGNICYTDALLAHGYIPSEIRFFLVYGHYGKRLNYTGDKMASTTCRLRVFKQMVRRIDNISVRGPSLNNKTLKSIEEAFCKGMDDDLDVKAAFDGLYRLISRADTGRMTPEEAAGTIKTLKEIDRVLGVIFDPE
jgi:cysteinyl-tRNA synthetase